MPEVPQSKPRAEAESVAARGAALAAGGYARGHARARPDDDDDGLRGRLARQGEDALGKLAQELLENPLVNGAIARAFEAREKAAQAQEVAMGALNIPSAADLERLTRRVRSVSQRLEGIEDGVDRLDEHFAALGPAGEEADRLAGIEARLTALTEEIAALRSAMPAPRKRAPAKATSAPEPAGEAEPPATAPSS